MTAAALALLIGMTVSWSDRTTGDLRCGRLTRVDARDGIAWMVPDTNPQWYAIEPIGIISKGCPR